MAVFNAVSIVSAFTLSCIYLGALLVKLHHDFQLNLSPFVGARLTSEVVRQTTVTTLSFNSGDTIVSVIAIFTFLVVILVAAAFVQRFLGDAGAQTFRLKGGMVPELTHNKGHLWHLFLSHSESITPEPAKAGVGTSF